MPDPEEQDRTAPERTDADVAREAVENGRSVPFSVIAAAVAAKVGGTIVDVAIARDTQTRVVYAVKVLTSDGQLRWVTVDGRRGVVETVR